MPPKKQKVKVRKSSKRGDKGVNIKIVIDQSKKTKGVAPKPPVVRRALPAFSAMPQGPSHMGANYPLRQDYPAPSIDTTAIGDRVFNQLLEESNRRQQSARGFGGFQTAGSQLNQIYDGQYSRMGRNNAYIISNPSESSTTRSIDNAVFDDPETNNQILGNKLSNQGSRLPNMNENSIGALNEYDRQDNNISNIVIHEKKKQDKMEASVNADLDEDLLEEEGDEDVAIREVRNVDEQAQREKELSLQTEEESYKGVVLTDKVKTRLIADYQLPPYPVVGTGIPALKSYIMKLNEKFGKTYDTNFKGRRAVDELRRVIRIAFLKQYDDVY